MSAKNRKKDKDPQISRLKERLQAAEEALNAIRSGGIDAVVVSGGGNDRIFTLAGADNAYRAFVESMNEGAVTISPSGTVLYCNRAFADLLKKPLEKLIGASIEEFVPAAEFASFEGLFSSVQEGEPKKVEMQLRRSNGEAVPVYLSLKSFQEFGSRALCMVVTDLTEQKRNEKIVTEGKLASLILEQSSQAIAVCDNRGSVVLANDALHRLCGSNPLFRLFDDALPLALSNQPQGDRRKSAMFSVFGPLGDRRFRGVEVCFGSGADRRRMLLSAAPIKLPSHGTHGCVITLYDIEERIRSEEALRNTEKLAATGRLAATIAHEVNNPLEAITNLLYLIESAPALEADVAGYVKMAQEELGRVSHIAKQTLAFHRECASPIPVNIKELIESVMFIFRPQIEAKGVQLLKEVEYDDDVQGYPNELRQVVMNLFANALEASPSGAKVRIRAYRSQEWSNSHLPGLRIVIADQGPGISTEHKPRLFDPFFTTKGEKGTGLGLWVTRGIVNRHGGAIRLKSSSRPQSSGTTFSIFLPFSAASGSKTSAVA